MIGRHGSRRGFTLLELVVVLAILGLLLAGTIAVYGASEQRARERALRQTLQIMRDAIDAYRADRDTYPGSLQRLVEEGYLTEIPEDPLTGGWNWEVEIGATAAGGKGVWDVHSTAPGSGVDGVAYSEW